MTVRPRRTPLPRTPTRTRRTSVGTVSGAPLPQPLRAPVARRSLLAAGASSTTLPLAGCQLLSTDPAGESENVNGTDSKGNQAPMLAQRVADGDLPPVDQRLPSQPLVVEPIEAMGRYGGTLTMALDENESAFLFVTSLYDNLVVWRHWDSDWNGEVVANVAEEYEVRRDGAEYVFHLRAGMRWSDGEPFTADDIVFAVDNVLFNTDIYPLPPDWLTSHGDPASVEKVDDVTVRFIFPAPNGLFLQELATPHGHDILNCPRHYMEQFHADYNDDIDELVEAEEADDWVDLFFRKGGPANWGNATMPTVGPWRVTSTFGADADQVTLERNPYYWKVDPDDSQLPYIDHVEYHVSQDLEPTLLKILNGEVDLEFHRVSTNQNKPVLAQDRESGGYRFFNFISGYMNYMAFALNLTVEDEVKREVFNNVDFRVGLSHAINRDEIIAAVYQGVGEPWQAAPRPESVFYDEEFAKQYTEYDPDLANQHLDAAGYTDRDGDDFRLGPDGSRILVIVDVPTHFEPHWVESLELVTGYWADVGVDARIKQESRTLFDQRVQANQHDAAVWLGGGGLYDALLDTAFYFPSDPSYSLYGIPWAEWFNSNGEAGIEPPAAFRKQIQLYRELEENPDTDTQTALMKRILEIAKQEFHTMGIAMEPTSYGIVNSRLRNLPEDMVRVWLHADFGPSTPAQYFFEA